jgi:hypothetical protein
MKKGGRVFAGLDAIPGLAALDDEFTASRIGRAR